MSTSSLFKGKIDLIHRFRSLCCVHLENCCKKSRTFFSPLFSWPSIFLLLFFSRLQAQDDFTYNPFETGVCFEQTFIYNPSLYFIAFLENIPYGSNKQISTILFSRPLSHETCSLQLLLVCLFVSSLFLFCFSQWSSRTVHFEVDLPNKSFLSNRTISLWLKFFSLNKSINNDRITWLDFKVRYKDANNLEQKNENYQVKEWIFHISLLLMYCEINCIFLVNLISD